MENNLTPKKALEELKRDNQEYHDDHNFNFDFCRNKRNLKIIEKAIKEFKVVKREYEILWHENQREHNKYEIQTQILEVLKNKDVDLQNFKNSCNCEDYNEYVINEKGLLAEKEYDLLEEWLK